MIATESEKWLLLSFDTGHYDTEISEQSDVSEQPGPHGLDQLVQYWAHLFSLSGAPHFL